jgi:hypothetical protein
MEEEDSRLGTIVTPEAAGARPQLTPGRPEKLSTPELPGHRLRRGG